MTEEHFSMDCTETEDGRECTFDIDDGEEQVHAELECEEEDGVEWCEMEIEMSGEAAGKVIGSSYDRFNFPETEQTYQSRRVDDDYYEKVDQEERFESEMLGDD